MTASDAQTYEFRVAGHLDDHWSAWFENLTIARHDDGTSTLTGPVADQAQLHGILAKLRDIGATLLSVDALAVSVISVTPDDAVDDSAPGADSRKPATPAGPRGPRHELTHTSIARSSAPAPPHLARTGVTR